MQSAIEDLSSDFSELGWVAWCGWVGREMFIRVAGARCWHRSHFGLRYTLGCCRSAGLLSWVRIPVTAFFPPRSLTHSSPLTRSSQKNIEKPINFWRASKRNTETGAASEDGCWNLRGEEHFGGFSKHVSFGFHSPRVTFGISERHHDFRIFLNQWAILIEPENG